MSDIYEEVRKFAEGEKAEAEKALQAEENQVCIKADSYIAKEIKYQTAMLHQILNELREFSYSVKKENKKCEGKEKDRARALARSILEHCEKERFTLSEMDILLRDITFAAQDARKVMMEKHLFFVKGQEEK